MGILGLKNTAIIVLVSIIAFLAHERNQLKKNKLQDVLESTHYPPQEAHDKLKKHTDEFASPEIIQVLDGVYVGIGYALANTIVIEAETSLIVIDTMESVETATQFRNDFKNVTLAQTHNKPISTIIYTHYHPDHTMGTEAYVDDVKNPPTIISHPKTIQHMSRIFSIASSITNIRAHRQFGTILHEFDKKKKHAHEHNGTKTVFENSGIGPFLANTDDYSFSLRFPTKLLHDKVTKMTVDGIEVEIYHAPGETPDQIFIYLPSKKALFPADNIYRTFPNIYAIRGSPTRDARDWVHSLDLMRRLSPIPEYLVPHHTRPVYGKEKIKELLTIYRDGIAYVHDQTIRYMNKGFVPCEMIPFIHENMPKKLKNHPYLQEFYGTIDWSIRGIFNSYLGWFDGDAVNLFPLSWEKRGNKLIELLDKDVNKILSVAEHHINNNNHERDNCQWGLELATQISNSELPTEEERKNAKNIRVAGQQCMAKFMTSANGRNYYLTSSIEDKSNKKLGLSDLRREWAIDSIPLDFLIASVVVRLKVDKLKQPKFQYLNNFSVCQDFDNRWYYNEIRNGIIEVSKGVNHTNIEYNDFEMMVEAETHIDKKISKKQCREKAQLVTFCTESVFREILAGNKRNVAVIVGKGEYKIIKGSITDALNYRSLFETH